MSYQYTTSKLWLVPNALHNGYENLPSLYYNFNIPTHVQTLACNIKYWFVENAKTARLFLKSLNIALKYPIQEHEMLVIGDKANYKNFINKAIQSNEDIGLLSEAGLPAIADPGNEIVELAHNLNIEVMPLVGPCSIILALMGSGLNGQSFAFNGYMPINLVEKIKAVKESEKQSLRLKQTQICIETPYRNQIFAQSLIDNLKPSTKMCIASQISLPAQKIYTQTIDNWRTNNKIINEIHKQPCIFLWLA